MNPILFSKTETDFTTNGLGRLECLSCRVVEERNGMFELEAEIPVSGRHASEIEMLSIIGAIPYAGGNIQAFSVYKIEKPINGRFKVYARHISYRLSDIPCLPFSVALSPQACRDTLAGLRSNALEACPFTFETDVTTANSYTQKAPASIRSRLGGVEGSVLDQFGGEYKWDNWTVRLLKQRGRLSTETGITLRYGKNITDINQEKAIAETATGIVPYWIDTDGNNLVMLPAPNRVVYSQNAGNFPYHLTEVVDFSSYYQDKPTVAMLRSVAETYVNKDGFGEPKVSIKVSFVDLWKTEEYKDIAPLEMVNLCDEVIVDFEKLGIKAIAKVVKTDYDVLKERYNSIEVGSIRTTLAQAVTDREQTVDTAFIEQLTRVNTAISDATKWLTSANGYVVAVKNDDGSWKELLFMNTNDPATATAGIRINNNGIGFFSKALTPAGNVLSGPYSTAWTMDGRLGDFANKNFWNFVTGQFSLSAGTTVGGQTVQAIADAAQAAAEAAAAAALAATAQDLQSQIDGQIMTWFYDYAPTTSNAPASTWTTVADKSNHVGDLFYDGTTGYCYRWQVKTTAQDPAHPTINDFEWVQISDEDIAEALHLAEQAQDTADNKRRIFITQPVPPYDEGDLWCEGSTGDILTCTTPKTEGQTYAATDWEKLNKYTDDTAVGDLNTALNQQEIFNRLTNNQQNQGIYLQSGSLYINASMIGTGTMIVGGPGNDVPELLIKDADGHTIGKWTKTGITIYNSSGQAVFSVDTAGNVSINGYATTSQLSGYATNAGLANGTTQINGGCITTGELNASLIKAGAIQSRNYSFTTGNQYLNAGMRISLDSGNIFTKSFSAFGENEQIYMKQLIIKTNNAQESSSNNYIKVYNGQASNKMTTMFGGSIVVDDTDDHYKITIENDDVRIENTNYTNRYAYINSTGLVAKRSTRSVNLSYDDIYRTTAEGDIEYNKWTSSSDRSVKNNIEPIDTELSMALIDRTEPKSFVFRNRKDKHYGMIAQEVREILDDLGQEDAALEHSMIPGDNDSKRALDYEEYIPHLINYVKELKAEIDELKKRLDK